MDNKSGVLVDIMKYQTEHYLNSFFRDIAKKEGYLYSSVLTKNAHEIRMEHVLCDLSEALVESGYQSPMKNLIERMSEILKRTAGLTPEMQMWQLDADALLKGSDNF